MRRIPLLLLLLLTGVVGAASAQTRLSATLNTAAPQRPQIQLTDLFSDRQLLDYLKNDAPVRLSWTVEIWCKRCRVFGITDGAIKDAGGTWQNTIRQISTLKQYHFLQTGGGQPYERTYNNLDSLLVNEFGKPLEPEFVLPKKAGEYYYSITLEISTLTSEDVTRLLSGQGQGASDVWGSISKGVASQFLPGNKLLAQTGTFRIP